LLQILSEVGEEQQAIAQQKQITLEVHNQESKLVVSGDRDRLGRLFTNLISNAISYTPAGGKVQIIAQPRTSQNQIQVQIKDTGIGIPEAELSQIFERFYRYQPQKSSKSSAKSINPATSGSGLGLAIAKAIADSHQGQINVESKVGQGTTFTVILSN
jgi:OmpR-family two-component system manganese-sensing sensor histidine kinase